MVSVEEIRSKVVDTIAKSFKLEPASITDEKSFTDDLGADSLETVELVMALEEEFGIEISDEDAEKIRTVGDAVGSASDLCDLAVLDPDVALEARDPRPVDDGAAADVDVVVGHRDRSPCSPTRSFPAENATQVQ